MVKLVCPPDQVIGVRDEVSMEEVPAEPLRGTAMVAEVIGRSVAPKALEMMRRMVGADWVMNMV